MIRLALILLGIASSAMAETSRVYSGEHGSFTRLVVELPNTSGWILGRTADGYAFATGDTDQPDYDLADVWQRISRSRATAIARDPDTGALRLTLGCDCHIQPFEYRPGVVVLDIKPGKAPQASAFEADFETRWTNAADPEPAPETDPAPGYSWLGTRATAGQPGPKSQPLPLATGGVSLEPLRDELLEQLARGAADGIVDLGLPANTSRPSRAQSGDLPWSGIRIGQQPGLAARLPEPFADDRTPATACADAALLDIAAWGEAGTPSELLASARSGLYGEFDIPDPDAVLRSVRLHLHLGFGAEAIQVADLATDPANADLLSLYSSMGHIIDGDPDPATPFAEMLDCDGPAALWAAMARDRLPRGPGVNRAAILRAFQALPAHLRSHLGTGLAERFLVIDDPDAARMVRDAMSRAPNTDPGAIALLDASTNLHAGNTEAARHHAAEAVALDGSQATGLVTLVEAHFRDLRPLGAEVPEALLSLRSEIGQSDLGAKVDRAIVLSLALSNQIDAAFSYRDASDEVLAELWQVAASRAEDDSFLGHAVLPEGVRPPKLSRDLASNIARRLLDLGFFDAALVWLGPVSSEDSADRKLFAARAKLGLGDARATIQLLEGMDDLESEAVRALALLQLGDLREAATALLAAGKPEEAVRVALWQGEVPSAETVVPGVWKDPALAALPVAEGDGVGLLGRAAATVDSSLAARAAIETLLQSVARPSFD